MRPWLQLPRLVFLYGCHCSFLPAGNAADAEATITGSGDNASFEVPVNGNPRLIRAEQSQSEEDMQAGPVQEAALVWMNETTAYDENCGGPSFISTCGFHTRLPIKFVYKGIQRAIRGLCVCVGGDPAGTNYCTEPQCTDSKSDACGKNGRPFCADGETCITQSGRGWQCWDPCDSAKQPFEYGQHSDMVTQMRAVISGCAPQAVSSAAGPSSQGPWLAPAPSSGGGQPVSSAQSPHLGPVSSSNAKHFSWGRNPPLDAGLYLAYNRNPFGGRIVVETSKSAIAMTMDPLMLPSFVMLLGVLGQR